MFCLCYRYLALLMLLSLPSLAAANVIISEVLADPPEGSAGDANRDGQRDPHEDEFIELYNTGSRRVSLAGWRLGDAGPLSDYFRFPAKAIIEPGSYVVLFGGGNPAESTIPVYTDNGTIGDGLTDSGEAIHLINKRGHEVAFFSHTPWPDNQSLTRISPDSSAFVPHKTISPTEELFSPGHAPGTRPPLVYPLIISEVLADPPLGLAGDANRDGQRDPHEDEFIELYNAGPVPISLAGWRLGGTESLSDYFHFPSDAVVGPGLYVVLFGGGNPAELTIPVYTNDGAIGDGLTDSGEAIHLIDDHGHEISFLSESTWPEDQSLVRTSPDSSAFVPHKTASPTRAPFSPGHAPGTQPPLISSLFISEVLADPSLGLAGDANRDGRRDWHEDQFIELYNAGPAPVSLAGWRLGDEGPRISFFRFPSDAVIESGSYVVLFGGGNPTEFSIPVYTDDGTIGNGLPNTGEAIYLIDDHGHEVSFLSHATWPEDQSLVRISPDSSAFFPHKTVSETEAPFSPGYAPDLPPESEEPETPSIPSYPLFISEVLADPPEGLIGDANRDGQRDPYEDEFIELYNAGADTISLASWQLGDAASLIDYFRFPPGAFIAPGSYVVLFGGGNPSEFTVPIYTDDGTIGDGLTDSGEAIYLIDKTGNRVATVSHSTWPDDQSIVRTSADSAFVPHKTASLTETPFSPGRAIEILPGPASAVPKMASATSLRVWPNPFNATTHLRFFLNHPTSVHVAIYNVQGQRVRTLVDAPLDAGVHQMRWDGRDERGHLVATGPYFVRFHIAHSPPHYAKLVLIR
ncbi:MAG: lamin tail domain-containing protein [Gemmatimonadota bacterium]|nr:lamin tail domain-containing protein [Gemmatimonadota bacterium]